MLHYSLVYPEYVAVGSFAYLEGDLPGSAEDFQLVARIEREGKNYVFYCQGDDNPFVIDAAELVFVLMEDPPLAELTPAQVEFSPEKQQAEGLDLPGALKVIGEGGYEQQPTEQPGRLFMHADYGSAYCQTERDVLDFAEAMNSARESMRGAMEKAIRWLEV